MKSGLTRSVFEEKNAAREQAIQIKTRENKNAYKQARPKNRRLFRKKARQLDEEASIEIDVDIGVFRTLVNFKSA
jgi:hypothetical protein